MATETDQFIIDNATWNDFESREITGDRVQSPPKQGNLKSAAITCKACGHSWTAYQTGNGRFSPGMGGVVSFTCPSCSKFGTVASRLLS